MASASERRLELINIATEKTMDMVSKAVEAHVDRAVAAARRAFENSEWSRSTPVVRAGAIGRFVAALHKRCVAIARDERAEPHAAGRQQRA
ncbi:MAG: aldehyde dehydrogenase family protein [Panacagrimonas sp.]